MTDKPAGVVSAPICPYCGDGMESIGTLNHIECATKLLAEVDQLKWMLVRIRDSEYDRMSDADALADLAARYDARHFTPSRWQEREA